MTVAGLYIDVTGTPRAPLEHLSLKIVLLEYNLYPVAAGSLNIWVFFYSVCMCGAASS